MNQQHPSNVHYLPLPLGSAPNPFKAGTRKAVCFEHFLRGGTRDELIRKMRRTGASELTARSWLGMFRLYCRGVRAGRQREVRGSQ
ncbi:MAG: hypothetical protein EPO20_16065 [Betaproteobacteria bacterium]|nr:MAG: hypothetical protein EPO20_16065 [Betaproteobacteria bacterium]